MLHLLTEYARNTGLTTEPGFTAKEIRWLLLFKGDGSFVEAVDLSGGDRKSKGQVFAKCPTLSQGELIGGKTERSQCLYESVQTISLMMKAEDDESVKNRIRGKHAFFVSSLADCAKQVVPELTNVAIALGDETVCLQVATALREKKAKPIDTATIAVDFKRPLDSSDWHGWWQVFRKALSERPVEKQAKKTKIDQVRMLDFITGESITPVATQGKISGLSDVGGLSAGDVFIGFDKESFCSFGFAQGQNAAISEENATAYREALNHLIKNHSRRLGKSKVVYWYKGTVKPTDDPINMLSPSGDVLDFEEDAVGELQNESVALFKTRKLLDAIKTGERGNLGDAAFYVMVVSGASGRIMIRDWIEGQFGQLAQNVAEWFEDLEIVARDGRGMAPSPKFMAVMGATVRDLKELNTPFVSFMLRAALGGHGAPIPQSALAAAYARFKIDLISLDSKTNKPKPFNHARMGLIKAYHLRKKGGAKVTQELNECSNSVPYQCGRLMAVLADLQDRAYDFKVSAGVIQRYYAAASSTPALVFGKLIRNSHAHMDKKEWLSKVYTDKIAKIWSRIHNSLPTTFSLEEQTLFAMGYYQQIAAIRKDDAERKAQCVANADITMSHQ